MWSWERRRCCARERRATFSRSRANPDAVPIGDARVLPRRAPGGSRARVRPGQHDARVVSARLLNRNGQPMSDVPVGPSHCTRHPGDGARAGRSCARRLHPRNQGGRRSGARRFPCHPLRSRPSRFGRDRRRASGSRRSSPVSSRRQADPAIVHTVRIDAIAVDAKGVAVRTLTLATSSFGKTDRRWRSTKRASSTDEPRLIAIYLDEYQITPGASADRARERVDGIRGSRARSARSRHRDEAARFAVHDPLLRTTGSRPRADHRRVRGTQRRTTLRARRTRRPS